MKKWSDAEIQSLLEDNISKNDPALDHDELENFKMYQQLFDIVATQPTETLPVGFAKKVVHQIEYRQNRANTIVFYSLIGVLSLLGIVVAAHLFDAAFFFGVIQTIAKFKAMVTFCVVNFFMVQYFDKRFVRILE
jgi:hypothetical protein